MNLTLSETSSNSYIVALESVLTHATQPLESLVIAPNDPKMLSALKMALNNEFAVVLEVSQDVWDFDGKELPQAIEWALEQTDLDQLVLVEHTLAGRRQSRASIAASEAIHSRHDSYQKLVNGVHLNNSRNRAAQDRLAVQVRQVLQIPLVANRCSTGELGVHGLVYRADSGLFLAYDTDYDAFHPLVALRA